MVRAIVIVGLVVGAIVLTLFGSRLLDTTGDTANHPECDLLAGACSWTTQDGKWRLRLQELEEGAQGMEYVLQVSVPKAPDRFLAVLKGQSMYMGSIRFRWYGKLRSSTRRGLPHRSALPAPT